MKKLISLLPVIGVLAACGSAPTSSNAASATVQTDERAQVPPQDTTSQRVPNLFGSGN